MNKLILDLVGVSAINNTFRETKAHNDGMVVTINAKDKDGKVVSLLALDKVDVKVNGQTLIKGVDYIVGIDNVTVTKTLLDDLKEGTHTLSITLDGTKIPNQTITVLKLEEARLEATFADVRISNGGVSSDAEITLKEFDEEGDEVAVDLEDIQVFVDGQKLVGANLIVDTTPKVEIASEYLEALKEGEHTLKVILKNGKSDEITFKVINEDTIKSVELTAVKDKFPIDGTGSDVVEFKLDVKKNDDKSISSLDKDKLVVKSGSKVITRYTELDTTNNNTIKIKLPYLQNLALGEYEIVVEYDEIASEPATFKVVAGKADKAKSSVTPESDADVTKVTAGEIGSVTFEFKDKEGNPVVGKEVTLSDGTNALSSVEYSLKSNVPSGTVYTKSTIGNLKPKTDEQGKVTVYFRATDAVENATIQGKVDLVDLESGRITITPATFSAKASDAEVDSNSVKLTVKDVYGNEIEDLKLTKDNIKVVTSNPYITLSTVEDNTDGTYTITVANASGKEQKDVTITVEVNGKAVKTLLVDVDQNGNVSTPSTGVDG